MQRLMNVSRSACLHHAGVHLSRPQAITHKHALPLVRLQPPSRQQHRCMAAHGGSGKNRRNQDPTLGEISTELVSKVKQLPGAIYKGFTNLVNKLLPGREQAPPKQQRSAARSMTEGMFGGGIMGKMMERTVGRAVENLAQNAAEQLRAAQQQAEQLQESATQALESSEQLKQYMGGQVRIAEPISDSVSMQSVNGQRKQMIQLIIPVVGANGRVAHAQVQAASESRELMDIQVQLPDGRRITVDPNERSYIDDDDDDGNGPGGSQKGRVIDVDWREVRQ